MTAKEFCDKHYACDEGREWAESVGLLDKPMIELWKRSDLKYDWRVWILTRPGVASDRDLRLFACNCVRQIWDLVPPKGKYAVEVAERFANGLATSKELEHAHDAAWTAAHDAVWTVDCAASWAASWAAARAASWAAAYAAYAAAYAATWTVLDKQIELMEVKL